MLKHDHEHMPYFPAKNCTDPRQRVIEPIFEPHLLCGSKTELDETQRTYPALSDFLLVLCGRILPDRFRAPATCWKTTLKGLEQRP